MKTFLKWLIGIIAAIVGSIGLVVLWIGSIISRHIGIIIAALIIAIVLLKIFS